MDHRSAGAETVKPRTLCMETHIFKRMNRQLDQMLLFPPLGKWKITNAKRITSKGALEHQLGVTLGHFVMSDNPFEQKEGTN